LAQELSIEEPIDAAEHIGTSASTAVALEAHGEIAGGLRSADVERICVNPLRDEPSPAAIGAVKRFGLVGLIACALAAACHRWWKSVAR